MVEKRKTAEGGDEAPAKRQRVSRACDQCRAAREKCDGIRSPGCFTCLSSNRECTYTTPPKKRGIQPGYIRTLELTLAWIFENCPGAESTLTGAIASDQIAALLSGKDTDGAYKLHRAWRRSSSCKELEKLLGSGKADPAYSPDADSAEETSQAHDVATAPVRTPAAHTSSEKTFVATLPNNTWRLLDVYFAYTHTWLPILQKHDMLKLAYTYGEHGVHLSPGESPEHAELWALLALGAVQEEVVSAPASARTSRPVYETARRLIPDERGKQSVSHVKALILLSLINVGSKDWTAAWLLLGQAINIAIDLGLHKANALDHARSKHTILACFFLERILCSHLSRVPRLDSGDIAALGPVEEEGLEEWETWSGCDGFTQANNTHRESIRSSSRSPSHSLSIFNQLVVLSNGLPGPSMSISFPPHLQQADSRMTTPQLLHLHILQSCCVGNTNQTEQLLAEFSNRFGIAAMPAVFRIYLETAGRSATATLQAGSRGLLPDIVTSIDRVWSQGTVGSQDRSLHSLDGMTFTPDLRKQSLQNTKPQSLYPTSAPHAGRGSLSSQYGDASKSAMVLGGGPTGLHPDFVTSPVATRTPQTASAAPLGNRMDDMPPLERFKSNNSIDMEALFDELASLDGAESADHQPLFMQNLGLAPNADLNDVLASDFGFDPLLSTYMNTAPVAMDQSRTYAGG